MTWHRIAIWVLFGLCIRPALLAAGDKQPEAVVLGRPVKSTEVPSLHRTSIAFSPDGKRVAWVHCQPERAPNDGGGLLIHLWDLEKRLPVVEMKPINEFTYASGPLRFTPNGRMLAVGCFQLTTEHEELAKPGTWVGNNVRVWLAASGRELPIVLKVNGPVEEVWQAVAFSPDGKTLTAVTSKGGKVWKLPDGKEAAKFKLDSATNLILSADGKWAAGTLADKAVRIWSTEEGPDAGKEQQKLPGAGRPLGFSPDGKTLATFLDDKVCLWDLQTGNTLWKAPGKLANDEKHGQRFDFSPDSKRIAWNDDGKISIVAVATGKLTASIKSHPGPLAFSPDGTLLALGCPDGTAMIWDVK